MAPLFYLLVSIRFITKPMALTPIAIGMPPLHTIRNIMELVFIYWINNIYRHSELDSESLLQILSWSSSKG
jgi:hypothetical protein